MNRRFVQHLSDGDSLDEVFLITDKQLREIEDEGIENEWPPLSEAAAEVG